MKHKPDINNSATEILEHIQFNDIFNLVDIQRLQDLFSDANGVASIITHPDGTPITKPSNFCHLCIDIIRKTEKGLANCYQSDAVLGRYNPSGPNVQPCLSGGLCDAGTSITVGGKHIANWLIGQVRNEKLDEQQMIHYADEIGANRANFMEALKQVPVMPDEQFKKVSKMLFAFANEISEKAFNNLLLKKQIAASEQAQELAYNLNHQKNLILEAAGEGILGINLDGNMTFVNPMATKILGYGVEELLFKNFHQLFHHHHRDGTIYPSEDCPVYSTLQNGKSTSGEDYFWRKDGKGFHVRFSSLPIIENEKITGAVVSFRDITVRKQAEEALQKSAMQFHSLYMNMIDCASLSELTYNEDGAPIDYVVIETNPAFKKQLENTGNSVIGMTGRKVFGLNEPPFLDVYARVTLTGEPVTFETYFQPFGKNYSISIYSPYKGRLATIFKDITERKHAEEALRQSEIKLQVIIESTADGILAIDDNGQVIKTNHRFAELWKIPPAILNSGDDAMLLNFVLEQLVNPKQFIDKVQKLYNSKDEDSDTLFFKDGRIFERYSAPLLLDEKILGRVWSFRDITERKQSEAEIKLKNEQLLELNAAKDKFFSIIAHDLREPFSGFLKYTQVMAEDLPNLTIDQIQEFSVDMRKSATNLYRLLENLLQWSKMQQGSIPFNPELLQLLQVVDECITMVIEQAKNKGIEITYDVPDDLKVFADSNILQTVIRNLVSNAMKFTPKGGKISVSAKATADKGIEISVKDTGIGMTSEMVNNLFRLDVKTNRKGTDGEPSSGLGLLLYKEFVEKLGGKIRVESEEGKGSTFYFTIP